MDVVMLDLQLASSKGPTNKVAEDGQKVRV